MVEMLSPSMQHTNRESYVTSPWACHLVAVVKLVHLNDPKSYAGWGSGPWEVQPCQIGQGGGT